MNVAINNERKENGRNISKRWRGKKRASIRVADVKLLSRGASHVANQTKPQVK